MPQGINSTEEGAADSGHLAPCKALWCLFMLCSTELMPGLINPAGGSVWRQGTDLIGEVFDVMG